MDGWILGSSRSGRVQLSVREEAPGGGRAGHGPSMGRAGARLSSRSRIQCRVPPPGRSEAPGPGPQKIKTFAIFDRYMTVTRPLLVTVTLTSRGYGEVGMLN